MATVFITNTAEIRELHLFVDLQDYAFETLDYWDIDADIEHVFTDADFMMSSDDYYFWKVYMQREERICERINDLGEYVDIDVDLLPKVMEITDYWAHDPYRLQDELEALLELSPWYDTEEAYN